MNLTKLFAAAIVCLTATLCFSCSDSNNHLNTSDSKAEAIDSDSGDGTDSNDDANTEPSSDTAHQCILSSHISGGGIARSSNYSVKLTAGGSAAATTSSTNYGITIGSGTILHRK